MVLDVEQLDVNMPDHHGMLRGARIKAQKLANELGVTVYINLDESIVESVFPDILREDIPKDNSDLNVSPVSHFRCELCGSEFPHGVQYKCPMCGRYVCVDCFNGFECSDCEENLERCV